jgi:hypothetical protein
LEPFINLAASTPQPRRLKSVCIRGADGRLESIWVPGWELEREGAAGAPAEPARRAG